MPNPKQCPTMGMVWTAYFWVRDAKRWNRHDISAMKKSDS